MGFVISGGRVGIYLQGRRCWSLLFFCPGLLSVGSVWACFSAWGSFAGVLGTVPVLRSVTAGVARLVMWCVSTWGSFAGVLGAVSVLRSVTAGVAGLVL